MIQTSTLLLILSVLCASIAAHGGSISKNHTFVSGTTISSSQINSNFDQLIAELNAKETRIATLEGAGGGTWSLSGSDVYYNAGNVGIGTAAPSQKLDVTGNVNISNQINVRDEATFGYTSGSTGGVYLAKPATYGKPAIQSVTSAFGVDNLLLNPAGGNVGIGTTSPAMPLHVGTGAAGTNITTARVSILASSSSDTGLGVTQTTSGVAGILQASGAGLYTGTTSNHPFIFRTNDTDQMTILANGNVGIGDTSPDTKLKVVGAICAKSNDADCAGAVAGTVYANNTTVQNADYAEYFLAVVVLNKGDIVGLNPTSRLARGYKAGDKLLGIVSTSPGIAGNSEIQNQKSVLVALLGQVPFNSEQTRILGNQIFTLDGNTIGYLLADGKAFINIASNNQEEEIRSLKKTNKKIMTYLCKKEPGFCEKN